jgi:hypothetical protein
MIRTRIAFSAVAAAALLVLPRSADAHFLWLTLERSESGRSQATLRVFLNEEPVPGGPEFLKYVRDVKPTAADVPVPVTADEDSLVGHWTGKLPSAIDATLDLGIKSRGETVYRLFYTARVQTNVAALSDKETGTKLRVRLVAADGKNVIQVLFDGKSVPNARIKIYPEGGESKESTADSSGLATIPGLAEGKTSLWANWADGKAGEINGKKYSETRYYATLTVAGMPSTASDADGKSAVVPTHFATMPAPSVNSFGGAVLGDWLYVYSGHAGRTHQYSLETTSKHFRRLNLRDKATWEDLPMSKDVQGVALVSDGSFVYRIGGMSARNQPGQKHDLHSVVEFSRFDPGTKTWNELPPLPQARSTHDAVVIGQTIYVVGGWTMKGASDNAEYLENAVAYDIANAAAGWTTIPQPFKRRALSAGESGGKLYVLGGLNDSSMVERRVDVYDPRTKSWALGPELPGGGKSEGFGTSAFSVGGRLYYSGAAGRIFRLNESGNTWDLAGAWALPRITHRLLPGPGPSLLAVGGNAAGKQVPVIEAVELPANETPSK